MKRVLITRELESASELKRELAALGIEGLAFPVTRKTPIDQKFDLPELLHFDGILFTSSFAVELSESLFRRNDCLLPEGWKYFAVGESTANAIMRYFNKDADIVGKTGGSDLAASIGCSGYRVRSLLWPSAKTTAVDMVLELGRRGVGVMKWPIYRTTEISQAELADSLLRQGNFDAIFFASPSAVRTFTKFVNPGLFLAIAIGRTTGQELADSGWKHFTISNSPEAHYCAETILRAIT